MCRSSIVVTPHPIKIVSILVMLQTGRRLPPPETLLGLRPGLLGVPSQFGTIPLAAFGQLGAGAAAAANVQTALLQQQLAHNAVRLQHALAAQQQQNLQKPGAASVAENNTNTSVLQVNTEISHNAQNASSTEPKVGSSLDTDQQSDNVASSSTSVRGFECTYRLCRHRFNTMTELHQHIKSVHQGSCYVCKDCGKTFGSYMGLKFHSSKHTGKFRFNCPHCSKGFNRIEQFQSHMNMHDGQGFVCLKCKKVFLHKAKLIQHSKTCYAR